MGNPQPKDQDSGSVVQDWEIGWLAGMLDADGSIMMNRHQKRRLAKPPHERVYLEPYVFFYGTDVPTLHKIDDILCRLRLAHYISWNANSHGYKKSTGQKRRLWAIRAVGFKRAHALLVTITPYLTTKRPQADLILQWTRIRLAMPTNGQRRKPYTSEEIGLVDRIRNMNRGLGSETKRWVPNY